MNINFLKQKINKDMIKINVCESEAVSGIKDSRILIYKNDLIDE